MHKRCLLLGFGTKKHEAANGDLDGLIQLFFRALVIYCWSRREPVADKGYDLAGFGQLLEVGSIDKS